MPSNSRDDGFADHALNGARTNSDWSKSIVCAGSPEGTQVF